MDNLIQLNKYKKTASHYLSKTRHYIPSIIMLYSHTVTDLATQRIRTITNYDPRRRLRTTFSTLSGATKQTATNCNTHNNGFVVADSSSTK